jgi:hypothetical protein
MSNEVYQRRTFLKQAIAIGTTASIAPSVLYANTGEKIAGEGYTFLFQGDSITDGNRTRNNDWNHVMGH